MSEVTSTSQVIPSKVMIDTKTQKALFLLKSGDVKGALKIFKSFRLGFSKDEKRIIGIACECLCGSSAFYSSIGVDCERIVEEALSIVSEKYK